MDEFKGYLLNINGIKLPFISQGTNIIKDNSYSVSEEHSAVDEWTDILGTLHRDLSPIKKKVIKFTIRERTLEQHKEIAGILKSHSNILIEYWDDVECKYKTGNFFMEVIETAVGNINNSLENGTIFYDELPLTYMEY